MEFIYIVCCDCLGVDFFRVEDEWYQPIDMHSDSFFFIKFSKVKVLPEIALIKKGPVRQVLIRPFFIGVKTGSKRMYDSNGNSVTSEGVELLM